MENFDMSQFVTQEELEAAEAEQERLQNEALAQYDRVLYCADSSRIIELVQNVFTPAQNLAPDNMFYEANDNYIKWSLQALSANMAQFIIVEGLLSHRSKSGLLAEMYASEAMEPFKVLPSNVPAFKGTAFLGKIRDEKTVQDILENVVRVAGIPVDDESQNVAIFPEPLNPALPQMTGFCIALINLTDLQMSNLRKASKTKKVSDKMQRVAENFNTSTYSIAKMGLEGVATPAIQMVGKSAGLVVGTMGVATFKASASAVAEVTGAIARADVRNCREVNEIKHNVSKIVQQFGGQSKNDTFSFTF